MIHIENTISIKDAKSHLQSLWLCFFPFYCKKYIGECIIRMMLYYHKKGNRKGIMRYMKLMEEWEVVESIKGKDDSFTLIFIMELFSLLYSPDIEGKYESFKQMIECIEQQSFDVETIKSSLKYCIRIFRKSEHFLFVYECYSLLIEKYKDCNPEVILEGAKVSELLGIYKSAAKYYDIHASATNMDNSKMSTILCSLLCNDKKRIQKHKDVFRNKKQEQWILEDIAKAIKAKDSSLLSNIFNGYGSTPALIDIKKKIDTDKNIII